jgi:hypothetical protein
MAERIDDQELQAIQQVIAALSELDAGARTRVIDYVFQRVVFHFSADAFQPGT